MKKAIIFFFLLLMTLYSFRKEKEILPERIPDLTNKPPVAKAGPPITVHIAVNSSSNIFLNGEGADPDGHITAYEWKQLSGPVSVFIATPDQPTTYVQDLPAGVFQFQFSVTDNQGAKGVDTAVVTIIEAQPQPPLPVADTLASKWFRFGSLDLFLGHLINGGHIYSLAGFYLITDSFLYDWATHETLIYTKNNTSPDIINIKDSMLLELPHSSSSVPYKLKVSIDTYNNEVYMGISFPVNFTPGNVLISDVEDLINRYQFRVIVVPKSTYNNANIDWSNYQKVVAALNITP